MDLPVDYTLLTREMRRKVRMEYVKRQNNKCWYCNQDLDGEPAERCTKLRINKRLFPEGFFEHSVHLQHDHNTGLTEGAVHAVCNAVLWQYHGR